MSMSLASTAAAKQNPPTPFSKGEPEDAWEGLVFVLVLAMIIVTTDVASSSSSSCSDHVQGPSSSS